jgi:hypothetical protein
VASNGESAQNISFETGVTSATACIEVSDRSGGSRRMTADALGEAHAVLRALQAAVDARDADALDALFDESAVLIGTEGDARDREALQRYLNAVVTQAESLRWDWHDVVPFHESAETLRFAGFGEIVVSDGTRERRAPIRLTVLAIRTPAGACGSSMGRSRRTSDALVRQQAAGVTSPPRTCRRR